MSSVRETKKHPCMYCKEDNRRKKKIHSNNSTFFHPLWLNTVSETANLLKIWD